MFKTINFFHAKTTWNNTHFNCMHICNMLTTTFRLQTCQTIQFLGNNGMNIVHLIDGAVAITLKRSGDSQQKQNNEHIISYISWIHIYYHRRKHRVCVVFLAHMIIFAIIMIQLRFDFKPFRINFLGPFFLLFLTTKKEQQHIYWLQKKKWPTNMRFNDVHDCMQCANIHTMCYAPHDSFK